MKIESNYGVTSVINNVEKLEQYLEKSLRKFSNKLDIADEDDFVEDYVATLFDEANNKLYCGYNAMECNFSFGLFFAFADGNEVESVSDDIDVDNVIAAFVDFFNGGTQWTSLFEEGAIVTGEAPTQKSAIKIKYKLEKSIEVHGDQVEHLEETFDSEDEVKAALQEAYSGTCCPECSSHQFEANNFIVPYAKASIYREVVKKGFFGSKYENEHVADTWIALDPYLNHGGMFDAGYLRCKNCGWEVTTNQDSDVAGNLLAGAIATWGALSARGSR